MCAWSYRICPPKMEDKNWPYRYLVRSWVQLLVQWPCSMLHYALSASEQYSSIWKFLKYSLPSSSLQVDVIWWQQSWEKHSRHFFSYMDTFFRKVRTDSFRLIEEAGKVATIKNQFQCISWNKRKQSYYLLIFWCLMFMLNNQYLSD